MIVERLGVFGFSTPEKVAASTGFSLDLVNWVLMGYRAALDVNKPAYPEQVGIDWILNWARAGNRPVTESVLRTIMDSYTGLVEKKAEEIAAGKPIDFQTLLKWGVVGVLAIVAIQAMPAIMRFIPKQKVQDIV